MTRTRYRIFEEASPHFLTCTAVAWLPIFTIPSCVEIILNSWRFLQRESNLQLYGYVILENHLHWIAAGDGLSDLIARFKSYTARQIIDELKTRGFSTMLDELKYYKLRHKSDQKYQLWQEGNHPQLIQNHEMMVQKLEYIHHNPVRRGYVDDPRHWRYSSARDYDGVEGLIEVVTEWCW